MNQESDASLLTDLQQRLAHRTLYKGVGDRLFHNQQVAEACEDLTTESSVRQLVSFLKTSGAFQLHAETHSVLSNSAEEVPVKILRASLTDIWPMGTHYWVRDNSLVGYRMLHLKHGDEAERALGKDILLSALTLISTPAQLKRFDQIIEKGREYAENPFVWPYIFFSIGSNLNTDHDEKWMHIQDAWQMLAVRVLQSIQSGALSSEHFTPAHLQFLGAIVPFFAVVQNATFENAGSWEELVALRSSVVVWELKFLRLLQELKKSDVLATLQAAYQGYRARGIEIAADFWLQVENLIVSCEQTLEKQFPFESPGYEPDDPRYREADSALISLLELNEVPASKEDELLAVVHTLKDPVSGALKRYLDDSYQGTGFFRPSTVQKLREYYGAPSGESSGADDFVMRRKIVPEGPEAAWLHFLFQLSSWAGSRYRATGKRKYFDLQFENLLDGLALITGENEYTLHADGDGRVEVLKVPSFLFPECYITDMAPDGESLVFPSPHTPLNWATAEARAAVDGLLESVRTQN